MSGVLDLAGPMGARDGAPTGVAFPMNKQGRHPDFPAFRGSIPHLHVPLSTLHLQPHDCPRSEGHGQRRAALSRGRMPCPPSARMPPVATDGPLVAPTSVFSPAAPACDPRVKRHFVCKRKPIGRGDESSSCIPSSEPHKPGSDRLRFRRRSLPWLWSFA